MVVLVNLDECAQCSQAVSRKTGALCFRSLPRIILVCYVTAYFLLMVQFDSCFIRDILDWKEWSMYCWSDLFTKILPVMGLRLMAKLELYFLNGSDYLGFLLLLLLILWLLSAQQ